MSKPNPGSIDAVEQGCLCPIMDNNLGNGIGDGKFWISEDCPLHATPEPQKGNDE